MTVMQLEVLLVGCVAVATLAAGVSMVLAMRRAR
jgi:hypothetical protein